MRALARISLSFIAVLAATVATNGGERAVTFSAYVPATKGDLHFGPTKSYAEGFGARAGLQLVAGNQGNQRAELHFEAFDAHFRRINDVQLPAKTTLYPGETRRFLAVVPIMEDVKRRYRICAILKTQNKEPSRMCGKYIAQKR